MMNLADKPSEQRTASHAVAWSFVITAVRLPLQFVTGLALARLLGPEQAGLGTLSLLALGLAYLLVDLGVSQTLSTNVSVTKSKLRLSLGIQLFAVSAVAAIMIITAGPISTLVSTPSLKGLILLSVAGLPAQVLISLGNAHFRSRLDHKTSQLCFGVGFLIGYVLIGTISAVITHSGISILIGFVAQSWITGLLLAVRAKIPLLPSWTNETKGIAKNGGGVLAANLVNWSIDNSDTLIIGSFLGPASVGLYSRAYTLLRAPTDAITTSAQIVLAPVFAESRTSISSARTGAINVLSVVSCVSSCILIPIAFIGEDLMTTLYGAAWADAGPLVLPLTIALSLHSFMAVCGPILVGRQRFYAEFRSQVLSAPIFIAATIIGASLSLEYAAWGVSLGYAVRALLLIGTLCRNLGISLAMVLQGLWKSVSFSAVLALPALCIGNLPGDSLLRVVFAAILCLISLGSFYALRRVLLSPSGARGVEKVASLVGVAATSRMRRRAA